MMETNKGLERVVKLLRKGTKDTHSYTDKQKGVVERERR